MLQPEQAGLIDWLAQPALRFGDEHHDAGDLVLTGLLTGTWQALEARLAADLTRSGDVDTEAALTAFRRERGLIAGAELSAWLKERGLRLGDLEAVLRRRELRAAAAPCGGAAGDVASALRAEAICSGVLADCADELVRWHAGYEGAAAAAVAGAATLDVDLLVTPASGLRELGRAELQRRVARLAALRAGYERFREVAISDAAVTARLAERRVDWTVVSGSELAFAREGAARETRLRVVHDGTPFAQVAADLAEEPAARAIELGRAPDGVGADLLAAAPGDLVGPWHEGERWRVLSVDRRDDPMGSPGARDRAREEVLEELIERFSAGKGGLVVAL